MRCHLNIARPNYLLGDIISEDNVAAVLPLLCLHEASLDGGIHSESELVLRLVGENSTLRVDPIEECIACAGSSGQNKARSEQELIVLDIVSPLSGHIAADGNDTAAETDGQLNIFIALECCNKANTLSSLECIGGICIYELAACIIPSEEYIAGIDGCGNGNGLALGVHIASGKSAGSGDVGAYLDGNVRFLNGVVAVAVGNGLITVCTILLLNSRGECTAGDRDSVICIVECTLGLVLPLVCLKNVVSVLSNKCACFDLDALKTLVAGTVNDGDSCAILDRTVVLGLFNTVAGDSNLCAVAYDIQAACANLNTHGLSVDNAVVDGQRTAAREVNAVAVRDIERRINECNIIIGVAAVCLDTAATVGCHGDILKHQSRVVVGNRTTHSGGDETNHRITDDRTVHHGECNVGVVNLERRTVCVFSGICPSMTAEIDGKILAAGVLLRTGCVVTQQIERLTRIKSSMESLVHRVV